MRNFLNNNLPPPAKKKINKKANWKPNRKKSVQRISLVNSQKKKTRWLKI